MLDHFYKQKVIHIYNKSEWGVCVYVCSVVFDSFMTAWAVAHKTPLSKGFPRPRILEWVAISSSRQSSQLRDQTHIFCVSSTDRLVLYH